MISTEQTDFKIKSRRQELRPALSTTQELQGGKKTNGFNDTGNLVPRIRENQQNTNNQDFGQTQTNINKNYHFSSSNTNTQENFGQLINKDANQIFKDNIVLNSNNQQNTYKDDNKVPENKKVLPARVRNGFQVQDQDQENKVYQNLLIQKENLQRESVQNQEDQGKKKAFLQEDQFEQREKFLKNQLLLKEQEEEKRKEKELEEQIKKNKIQQIVNNQYQFKDEQTKPQMQNTNININNNVNINVNQQNNNNQFQNVNPSQNSNNNKAKKILEDIGSSYIPNTLDSNKQQRVRTISQQQKNEIKVVNHEEKVAVATGVEEAFFEESTQEQQELVLCPEGCGRSFYLKALEKHVPNCKKLFQNKKKVEQKEVPKEKVKNDLKKTQNNWKEQSEKLRQKIKNQSNQNQ